MGAVWAISVSFVYIELLVWGIIPRVKQLNFTHCWKSSVLFAFFFLFVCMTDQTQMCPSSISSLGLFQGIILRGWKRGVGGGDFGNLNYWGNLNWRGTWLERNDLRSFFIPWHIKEGDILLYIRVDIPSKQIKIYGKWCFQRFFVEINEEKKWFLYCFYNPDKNKILSHLFVISKYLNDLRKYMMPYNWMISTLNQKKQTSNFLNNYHCQKYCQTTDLFQKTRTNLISLILNNSSGCFQDTCTIGLSDLHKLVVTVPKLYFHKQKPNIYPLRD